MKAETLRAAKPDLLRRTAEAWKTLCSDFDEVISDFQKKVCDGLDDDDIWRGKAQKIATEHGENMRKKMQEYHDKIEPVHKALTTVSEDIETYQSQLDDLYREINQHEDWSMTSEGEISGPSDESEQRAKYVSERDGILAKADDADRTASKALTNADDSLDFLNSVLAQGRKEEKQAAKKASKLATKSPDDLSFDEGKQLDRLLRNHGEDPAFAGEFLERVQPKQLVKLADHLETMDLSHWDAHGKGSGPDREDLIGMLQQDLGNTLAAGTSQAGSEYLGEDLHDGSQQDKLDKRSADYGQRLVKAADDWDTGFLGMGDHEDSGYRAIGMLLHNGEYSPAFLNEVGDGLVEADQADGFEALEADNLNYVDDNGRGGDPLVGLMTALDNSPDAAGSFFDPQRNDENLDHLVNRSWEPDTYDHESGPRRDTTPTSGEKALGHKLLGKALESATLDEQYGTPQASRVMSDMVHKLANTDESMVDPEQGTVPPPMRGSVGHMLSDYMGAVQESGGPHANTSDGLRLDEEAPGKDGGNKGPDWVDTSDGSPQPKFSQQEVLKVMGSAAYDPESYAEMRDANMVQTELRLDDVANQDSRDLGERRAEMAQVGHKSSEVFGGLDEARGYAIDEFYDGKDADYNSKIEAGGSLAKTAVIGAGGLAGGSGGAAGGAFGADVVDDVVDNLKQDSSNIVTRETADLKEGGPSDANDLLSQSLWKNQMWRDDVEPPPFAPGSDELDDPNRIIDNDGGIPNDYEEWVNRKNPYELDQEVTKNAYGNAAKIYADATGNRPKSVSATE